MLNSSPRPSYPVSNDHLRLIGTVVVIWPYIELAMEAAICGLYEINTDRGLGLTANIGFQSRVAPASHSCKTGRCEGQRSCWPPAQTSHSDRARLRRPQHRRSRRVERHRRCGCRSANVDPRQRQSVGMRERPNFRGTVGGDGVIIAEIAVYDAVQRVHGDRAVHCLKIGATADGDRAEGDGAAG